MSKRPTFYHDPDGSKWRAREQRITELMQKGRGVEAGRGYCELVYDNDEAPYTTDHDQLTAAGFALPPAESLNDEALATRLAELIVELSKMRVFLSFTDHLSDRELYCALVDEVLREERRDIPMAEGSAWHLDLSEHGGGLEAFEEGDLAPEVADRDASLPRAGCVG